jgi:hypothetical protein
MVDLGCGGHAVLLVDPVDLLLLAPDEVPVVALGLLPFAVHKPAVHAVTERRLELYVGAGLGR